MFSFSHVIFYIYVNLRLYFLALVHHWLQETWLCTALALHVLIDQNAANFIFHHPHARLEILYVPL